MINYGDTFLFLALATSVIAICLYLVSNKVSSFTSYAQLATACTFSFLVTAMSLLLYYFLTDNFSYVYVSTNSSKTMPDIYKIFVALAGKESSLLFSAICILFFGVLSSMRAKDASQGYYVYYKISILFFVFLFTLVAYDSNKIFLTIGLDYPHGLGIPPFIQHYNVFFSTIGWFLGLSGSVVLMSHAFASLAVKDYSNYWIRRSANWAFISFFSLLLYVFFGHYWFASSFFNLELWGNGITDIAALLPLIVAVPFMHVASVFVNRGVFRRFCFLYPFILLAAMLFSGYVMWAGLSDRGVLSERLVVGFSLVWVLIFATLFYIPLYIRSAMIMSRMSKTMFIKKKWTPIYAVNFVGLSLALIGAVAILLNLYSITVEGQLYKFNVSVYERLIVASLALLCVYLLGYFIASSKGDGDAFYKHFAPSLAHGFAHVGMFLTITGLALSSTMHSEDAIHATIGTPADTGRYELVVNTLKATNKDNTVCVSADIIIAGKRVMPDMCRYQDMDNDLFRVDGTLILWDTVSVAFYDYDISSGTVNLAIVVRPFLFLVPLGLFILVLGLYLMWRGKRLY